MVAFVPILTSLPILVDRQRPVGPWRDRRRKEVIDEHSARNETIVSDCHEFADKRVRLDLTSLPYNHAALNLDKRPNEAIVPNRAAVKIYGFNGVTPLPKVIDDACLTNRGLYNAVFHG
jgi:hypothetical protein